MILYLYLQLFSVQNSIFEKRDIHRVIGLGFFKCHFQVFLLNYLLPVFKCIFKTIKGDIFSRVQPYCTTAPNQVIHLVSILVYGHTLCLRYVVHQCQYLRFLSSCMSFKVDEYLWTAISCSGQEKIQTN